jgi:hypothetical protein
MANEVVSHIMESISWLTYDCTHVFDLKVVLQGGVGVMGRVASGGTEPHGNLRVGLYLPYGTHVPLSIPHQARRMHRRTMGDAGLDSQLFAESRVHLDM